MNSKTSDRMLQLESDYLISEADTYHDWAERAEMPDAAKRAIQFAAVWLRRAGESMAPIIKRCGCGAEYTRDGWTRLAYHDTHDGLEYRHCSCKSTIVVEVDR